jgi:hypothetical protein
MPSSVRIAAYGAGAAVALLLILRSTSDRPVVAPPAAPQQQASAVAPPSVASGGGITLRSVSVEFPTSDRSFPAGPGVDAVTANCTACHSPGMILNQPSLTAAQWQAEIDHMRRDFKAPVADEDVPSIRAYLEATRGAK